MGGARGLVQLRPLSKAPEGRKMIISFNGAGQFGFISLVGEVSGNSRYIDIRRSPGGFVCGPVKFR